MKAITGRLTLSFTPFLFTLVSAICPAHADTFVYDNAGRLTSVTQSNGLSYSYSPDEEANLRSASCTGTDSKGIGIQDWWQNLYFGTTGIIPLASGGNDGVSNLMKYELGLNPVTGVGAKLISESFVTYTDGKIYPYFTYVCSIAEYGSLILQQSSDGITWVSGTTYFQPVSAQDLGNGTEQITMRCLTPLPQASSLQFRLVATGSPSGNSYLALTSTSSGPPKWWANYAVTNGNAKADYGAVNQGQVKFIATAAVQELNTDLLQFGGAGAVLTSTAATLSATTSQTKDYAAINIGQLKAVAQPFYDRLLGLGYAVGPLSSGTYPWSISANPAKDYAIGNIGEVKYLFSFDVTYSSDPNNSLPDWWQLYYFGVLGINPSGMPPGGNTTYLYAYRHGLSPY